MVIKPTDGSVFVSGKVGLCHYKIHVCCFKSKKKRFFLLFYNRIKAVNLPGSKKREEGNFPHLNSVPLSFGFVGSCVKHSKEPAGKIFCTFHFIILLHSFLSKQNLICAVLISYSHDIF